VAAFGKGAAKEVERTRVIAVDQGEKKRKAEIGVLCDATAIQKALRVGHRRIEMALVTGQFKIVGGTRIIRSGVRRPPEEAGIAVLGRRVAGVGVTLEGFERIGVGVRGLARTREDGGERIRAGER
jgi:hypothetical protein